MAMLTDSARIQWPAGYSFKPFVVLTTKSKFTYSRESIQASWSTIPSLKSTIWTPHFQEVLIRGSLEGRAARDPKGASQICRRKLWTSADVLYKTLGLKDLIIESNCGSYKSLKNSKIYEARRHVKKDVIGSLVGWVSNESDDFSLIE
jgi:tRNA-specific adenosine deaminase 1